MAGQPYPSLFSGTPAVWRHALMLKAREAMRGDEGHWLWRPLENSFRDYSVYGTQVDVVDFNVELRVTSIWSQYLTTFLHIEADKELPKAMADELTGLARRSSETLRTEATARGARNGNWAEWGPCEACAVKANYIRLFEDTNLYRCRHCGRWAELVIETDRDRRRHRSDFDWEKALPLIDGDKWMKPVTIEFAMAVIREKKLGHENGVLAARRRLQEAAERSFRLPRPVAIEDVLPLAAQLFQKLGKSFTPEETVLEDGTNVQSGASGLRVLWANVTPDDFGFSDALGGGPYNQFARIEMPPCDITFRIFASRLDAFDIAGGAAEEVRRIAKEIKEICS